MLTPITPDEMNTSALQKIFAPSDSFPVDSYADGNELSYDKVVRSELTLPHVAFYIQAIKSIKREDCTFPKAAYNNEPIHLCSDSANISLVYRVTLACSLKYGALASEPPDSKIVRISLDDSSSGSGIHLNDNFTGRSTWVWPIGIGYRKMFVTDAIAQHYAINVKASNTKAFMLTASPVNKNPDYEDKELKTFEFGITGGGEAAKDPKAKLEANAKFTDQRWLTFNTQEYRIARSTPSAQEINFKWERERFATANSLLSWHTGAIWEFDNPVKHDRVSPISYRNFLPAMDTIYRASPTETGRTTFNMEASTTLRTIYISIYNHYLFNEAEGHDMPSRWKSVKHSVAFDVNWDHPVFTGGRAVNLQIGALNSRCVSVDLVGNVSLDKCS